MQKNRVYEMQMTEMGKEKRELTMKLGQLLQDMGLYQANAFKAEGDLEQARAKMT